MSSTAWNLAGLSVGLAIGLWCGQLLLALFVYWESVGSAVKAFKSVTVFLGGAGGGALIVSTFAPDGGLQGYIAGLPIGMVVGRFAGLPPFRPTEQLSQRESLIDRLPKSFEGRDLLIDMVLDPPGRVRYDRHMKSEELAHRYEQTLDRLASQLDE